MNLTVEAAKEYVVGTIFKYAPVRIAWAHLTVSDDQPIVRVKFWTEGDAFFADVWVEPNGQIYGEW